MVLVILLEIADFLVAIWKALLPRLEPEQPAARLDPAPAPAPRRRAF